MNKRRLISILVLEWLVPVIAAGLVMLSMYWLIGPSPSWIANLTKVEASILAFIGVIFAVLIGVLVNMNIQSRQSKSEGFGRIRQGVVSLENLVIERIRMHPDNVHWITWVTHIDETNVVLNKITRGWLGWDNDIFFENWLYERAKESQELLADLGLEGEHVHRIYNQAMKEILIGLHIMDEGIVGQRLIGSLFYQMGTLLMLITLAIVRLISLVSCPNPSFEASLYDAFALGFITIAHLTAFIVVIAKWTDRLNKRDFAWASVSGITLKNLHSKTVI